MGKERSGTRRVESLTCPCFLFERLLELSCHCISSRPPSETLQYGPISNLENARLFAASQFFTYEVCGIFLKKPGWERSWHRDAGDHARELLAALVAGRLPRSRLASRIRLAEAGIIPARCGMYSASADKKVCAARRAAPP
jgi:hypothetical protein